jgi:hypothetical protein
MNHRSPLPIVAGLVFLGTAPAASAEEAEPARSTRVVEQSLGASVNRLGVVAVERDGLFLLRALAGHAAPGRRRPAGRGLHRARSPGAPEAGRRADVRPGIRAHSRAGRPGQPITAAGRRLRAPALREAPGAAVAVPGVRVAFYLDDPSRSGQLPAAIGVSVER